MRHKKSKCSKFEESARARGESSYSADLMENLETDFEVLCELCKSIKESSMEKPTYEKILKLIGKSIEYSSASLFLLDKRKNQIEEVASIGKKVDLIDFVKFNIGSGFSAWVAMEKRPIILCNLRRKRFKNGIRSFISVPIVLREELFGVMNLSHIKPNAFGARDLKFLNLISSPLALGLERMLYYSEMRKKQRELEEMKAGLRELQDELLKSDSRVPFSQLLVRLDQKIKNPLSSIAENAQFLLKSMSSQNEQKPSGLGKKRDKKLEKRLKEISSEANQISNVTKRLLKMKAFSLPGAKVNGSKTESDRMPFEHLSSGTG